MLEIVIAICTRERPKMLSDLLQSCISLEAVDGISLRFILIESGPNTPSREVIETFSNQLPITYLHESRIGIVRARNCAIESFLAGKGDWLAFLDDDETVDGRWLHAMSEATRSHPSVNIFCGRSIMIEPDTSPKIFRAMDSSNKTFTGNLERAAVTTQNVMFHRSVFSANGHNMRFDMRLNTAGGSDFLLTHLLTDRGETIRIVPEAITREYLLPERAKFWFRTRKMVHQAHHRGLISLVRFGRIKGHASNLFTAVQALFRCIIFAVFGVIVLVFNEKRGLILMARSVGYACTAIGRPRILWRAPADIYDKVQGS